MSRHELDELIDDLFNEPEVEVDQQDNFEKSTEEEEVKSTEQIVPTLIVDQIESQEVSSQSKSTKKSKKKKHKHKSKAMESQEKEPQQANDLDSERGIASSNFPPKVFSNNSTETQPVALKTSNESPSSSLSPSLQSSPMINDKRKKKANGRNILRDIRNFSTKKLRSPNTKKISTETYSQSNHKEAVLSLQQMAFRLFSLQQESTEKRKELHGYLVQYGLSNDEQEKQDLENKIQEIREQLHNNELLMGNFEKNIASGQKGTPDEADAIADCASLERFLENDFQEHQTLLPNAKAPIVVSTPNVCVFFIFFFIFSFFFHFIFHSGFTR